MMTNIGTEKEKLFEKVGFLLPYKNIYKAK